MPGVTKWIILRCAGRSTLPLAGSLAEDGFTVWTPVETFTVSIPRANVRRKIRRPILASYVFAADRHLVDLLQLAGMTVKPRRGAGLLQPAHPDFNVLHAFGRIPLVAEVDLRELRRLEARRTPPPVAASAFAQEQRVRVKRGIGQGKVGIVIKSTPAKTKILCVGDRRPFEIATTLLDPEDECNLRVANGSDIGYGRDQPATQLAA